MTLSIKTFSSKILRITKMQHIQHNDTQHKDIQLKGTQNNKKFKTFSIMTLSIKTFSSKYSE
jgi:hypothetical protein